MKVSGGDNNTAKQVHNSITGITYKCAKDAYIDSDVNSYATFTRRLREEIIYNGFYFIEK